jgi:hypothetical protein
MKLNSLFEIVQGHQITDEELYVAEGNVPVITGKNEVKGYWNKSLVGAKDLPCITYPSKANSGEAYVQDKVFDANNTAVLIPKPEWRNKLNLHWVAFKLCNVFLDIATSKEGVSYLNKELVEEVDLEVPDKDVQKEELRVFQELTDMETHLEHILLKIRSLKKKTIIGT